jgi:hypothetical protein
MPKQSSDNSEQPRRAAYPYYSINKVIEAAEAVRDLGGTKSEVPNHVLAEHLGMNPSSGTFAQLVASAKAFGLLVGRGAYTLTDLAKRLFFPTEPTEAQAAMLTMLKRPEIYEKLIERFDGGRLPPNESLANILHREYGVSESWKPRVASLFIGSLREANVIDSAGSLRYSSKLHMTRQLGNNGNSPDAEPTTPSVTNDPPKLVSPLASSEVTSANANVWSFRLDGGYVRLETSHHLPRALWEKLSKYIEVLRPEEPDDSGAP